MTVLLPSSSSASLLWWPSSSAAAQLPADRREAKSKAAIKRPRLVYLFSAQITAASFRYFSVLRANSPDGNSDDACRTSPSNLFPPPLPKPLKGDQSREASVSTYFYKVWTSEQTGVFQETGAIELLDMLFFTKRGAKKPDDKSPDFIQNTSEIKCSPFCAIFIPTCHVLLNGGRALVLASLL